MTLHQMTKDDICTEVISLRREVAALAKGAAIFGCPRDAESVRNCRVTKAEDYSKEACRACWAGWAKQAAKAGKICAQCGKQVEQERECYAIPTCYACFPPPDQLPIRKAAQAGKGEG